MKNNYFVAICFVVMTFISIMLIAGISCFSNDSDYKIFSVEKGIAYFSFEYPPDWKIGINETEQGYTDIMIFAPSFKSKRNDVNVNSTVWSIFITYPDERWPDVKTAINDFLSSWQDTYDAMIIEQSEININGVAAEQYIISYKSSVDYPRQEPEPIIHREVFFNYNGLIWNISEISNEDYVNIYIHQKHLEHMLDTWQFID